MCGQMANLVGKSGGNKGYLTDLIKAICRDFLQREKADKQKFQLPQLRPTITAIAGRNYGS